MAVLIARVVVEAVIDIVAVAVTGNDDYVAVDTVGIVAARSGHRRIDIAVCGTQLHSPRIINGRIGRAMRQKIEAQLARTNRNWAISRRRVLR